MREIADEIENPNSEPSEKMVEISFKAIGPSRPSRILVSSSIKVVDLRKLIAAKENLPVENLKLILRGKVLEDNANGDLLHLQLKHGDSLIVAVKPKPPVGYDVDDDDDDDLKFELPKSTSRWQKKLYLFLRHKLKLPDILLMAIFSLTLKAWVLIILWFLVAPVAHKWDLGPLYILATGFCLIFLNLGRRQPGDVSAYSVFNEDFRELPGTFNAERIDRDVRTAKENGGTSLPKSGVWKWKNSFHQIVKFIGHEGKSVSVEKSESAALECILLQPNGD